MKFLEVKKVEAKSRQDYYNSLTPQQRLDKLDRDFGKGLGAVRERARIAKQIGKDTLAADVAIVEKAVVKLAKKGKK